MYGMYGYDSDDDSDYGNIYGYDYYSGSYSDDSYFYDDDSDSDLGSDSSSVRSFSFEEGRIIDEKHGKHLQNKLGERLQSGEFADVTIKAGGYSVRAHKLVLSLVSDYFVATFSSPWKDTVGETVSLDGLTADGLRCIVEYGYTGQLKVDLDTLPDILEAARYLLVSRVTALCDEYLSREIDETGDSDILRWCKIAVEFNLETSRERCTDRLRSQAIHVNNYQDFLQCAKCLDSKPLIRRGRDFIRNNLATLTKSVDLRNVLDKDDIKFVLRPCVVDLANYRSFLQCAKYIKSKPLIRKARDFICRNLASLLESADLRDVLEKDDIKFVLRSCAVDMINYNEFLQCAKYIDSKPAIKKACDFIGRNCAMLKNSEWLLSLLDHDDMTYVIQFDRHGVAVRPVGLPSVDFLVKWVEHDMDHRHQYLTELFDLLDLTVYDAETLRDMLSFPLICESVYCKAQVRGTLIGEAVCRDAAGSSEHLVWVGDSSMILQNISNPGMPGPLINETLPALRGKNQFEKKRNMEIVVYENTLYIARSVDSTTSTTGSCLSIHRYEPSKHNWIEFPLLQDARNASAFVATDDFLFVIGGCSWSLMGWTTCVDILDIGEQTWSLGVQVPRTLFEPIATASNSMIYTGGYAIGVSERQTAVFDYTSLKKPTRPFQIYSFCPEEGKWTLIPTPPDMTYGHTLVPFGSKLFLFEEMPFRAECYDPKSSQWTALGQQDFPTLEMKRIKSPPFLSMNDFTSELIVDDNGMVYHFSFETDEDCSSYLRRKRGMCVLKMPRRSIELLKRNFVESQGGRENEKDGEL